MKRTSTPGKIPPIYYKDAEVDKEKARTLVARIHQMNQQRNSALLNRNY